MATDRLKKKIGKGRHASTIKRTRQEIKLRAHNRSALSAMRTAIKKARTEKTKEALKLAIPIIARSAKKGLVHKRTASRLISRLTKDVNKVAK